MRGVSIEEAAAIGADCLMASWLATGERNCLLRAFQRGCRDRGVKRLRQAECDKDKRQHDCQRHQHVKGGARHIDPEIAERCGRRARESAGNGERDGDAGCS